MNIRIDKEPCPAYQEWQCESGAFFDSPEWANVLARGLDCTSWYIWDTNAKKGHLLPVFRRGPFSIGYLGFPILSDPCANTQNHSLDSIIEALRAWPRKPQLMRMSLSAFSAHTIDISGCRRPVLETCIENLPAWRMDATATRRRDLAAARRRCSGMAACSPKAKDLYELYASAVARNNGNKRYTHEYFKQLISLDGQGAQFHGRSCINSGDVAGMAVTVRHGDTAYYLHNGTKRGAIGSGVADLLISEAILSAQENGANRFNFLSSPIDQPGLIKFKEKWGGSTREAFSLHLPMNPIGNFLAKLL